MAAARAPEPVPSPTVNSDADVLETLKESPAEGESETLRAVDEAQGVVLGEAETLPPEPGTGFADAAAAETSDVGGREVVGRLASVDRDTSRVLFRIRDVSGGLRPHSGTPLAVPFPDLELLTGLDADTAIHALRAAGDVTLVVLGEGRDTRVVEVRLPASPAPEDRSLPGDGTRSP